MAAATLVHFREVVCVSVRCDLCVCVSVRMVCVHVGIRVWCVYDVCGLCVCGLCACKVCVSRAWCVYGVCICVRVYVVYVCCAHSVRVRGPSSQLWALR